MTLMQGLIFLLWVIGILSTSSSVIAESTKKSTFTVPITQSMKYQDIRNRAERMSNDHIDALFNQTPQPRAVRLNILGQRAAEIVPIFSLEITREQWLESPHISHWVSYNQASFSLLQASPNVIAHAEENSVASRIPSATVESPAESQVMINDLLETEIIQLVDEGADPQRLIKQGANPQFLIDELD